MRQEDCPQTLRFDECEGRKPAKESRNDKLDCRDEDASDYGCVLVVKFPFVEVVEVGEGKVDGRDEGDPLDGTAGCEVEWNDTGPKDDFLCQRANEIPLPSHPRLEDVSPICFKLPPALIQDVVFHHASKV